MFDAIFEKLRVPLLERALNASSARQRAIADNIANIDTPGYKAKDVNFHKMLEDSSSRIIIGKRTDQRHIAIDEGVIEEDQVEFFENKSRELDSGKNNVDIDHEMVRAAENQLYYSAAAKIVASKFSALHKAIQGRG